MCNVRQHLRKFVLSLFTPFDDILIDSILRPLEERMAVTKAELNAKLDSIVGQVAQEANEVKSVIEALEAKILSPVPEDYTEELEKLNRISSALDAIAPSVQSEIVQPLGDTELLSSQEVNDLQIAAGSAEATESSEPTLVTNDDATSEQEVVNPEQQGNLILGVDLGEPEPTATEALESAVPSQTSVLVDDSAISEESKPPDVPVKLEETPTALTQPLSAPTDAGVAAGEEPRTITPGSDPFTPVSRAQSEPETVEAVDKSGQVKNVQDSEGTTPDGIPLIK